MTDGCFGRSNRQKRERQDRETQQFRARARRSGGEKSAAPVGVRHLLRYSYFRPAVMIAVV